MLLNRRWRQRATGACWLHHRCQHRVEKLHPTPPQRPPHHRRRHWQQQRSRLRSPRIRCLWSRRRTQDRLRLASAPCAAGREHRARIGGQTRVWIQTMQQQIRAGGKVAGLLQAPRCPSALARETDYVRMQGRQQRSLEKQAAARALCHRFQRDGMHGGVTCQLHPPPSQAYAVVMGPATEGTGFRAGGQQ